MSNQTSWQTDGIVVNPTQNYLWTVITLRDKNIFILWLIKQYFWMLFIYFCSEYGWVYSVIFVTVLCLLFKHFQKSLFLNMLPEITCTIKQAGVELATVSQTTNLDDLDEALELFDSKFMSIMNKLIQDKGCNLKFQVLMFLWYHNWNMAI